MKRWWRNLQIWWGNLLTKIEYPVQDDTWPSRRWKRDGSDHSDLSGYQ